MPARASSRVLTTAEPKRRPWEQPILVSTGHGAGPAGMTWWPGIMRRGEYVMRLRGVSIVTVVLALVGALVGLATPSNAGPPGKWTVISGGGVTNIDEPGMYRTSDGVLHVAMMRGNPSTDSIDVAHISPSGQFLSRQAVLDNWEGLTEDPDFVPGAAGGIRMVFGGHTGSTGDPYAEGYVYQTSSDPTGTVWTLASEHAASDRTHERIRQLRHGLGDPGGRHTRLGVPAQQRDLLPGRRGAGAVVQRATCAAPTTWRWRPTASTRGPPGTATAGRAPPTKAPWSARSTPHSGRSCVPRSPSAAATRSAPARPSRW